VKYRDIILVFEPKLRYIISRLTYNDGVKYRLIKICVVPIHV